MAKYYFLICSLPRISLQQQMDISFEELMALMHLNLTEEDLQKVYTLRSIYDYLNLRAYWQKKPLDPKGALDEKKMEHALLAKDYFFDEVFSFMETHQSVEKRLQEFTLIFSKFFNVMIEENQGFLKKYFRLEKHIRQVMSALRAKKMKRDLTKELVEEENDDFFLWDILAQKDTDQYIPKDEFARLKTLYDEHLYHPANLQREFLQYRIEMIKNIECEYFSIDEVLRYLAVYFIIYDWQQLHPSMSKGIIEKLA